MISFPVMGLLAVVCVAVLLRVLFDKRRGPFSTMFGVLAGLFLAALIVAAGLQLLDLPAFRQG